MYIQLLFFIKKLKCWFFKSTAMCITFWFSNQVLKQANLLQWCALENQQSPFYDIKWGHFDRVNSTFKMLLSSWNFDTVFKEIRSFDAENLGSVG